MLIDIKVPGMGESVKQGTLLKWHKNDGDIVKTDEPVCELETDKANADISAPAAGILKRIKAAGQTAEVDEVIGQIDTDGKAAEKAPAKSNPISQSAMPSSPAPAASSKTPAAPKAPIAESKPVATDFKPEDYSPAVRTLLQENRLDPKSIRGTGPNGRLTKEDIESYLAGRAPKNFGVVEEEPTRTIQSVAKSSPVPAALPAIPAAPASPATKPATASTTAIVYDANGINRVPMTKIRKRIAQTLVQAQHTAAILTTFNEVDLTEVIELRSKFKDRFQEVYGVGLGFMSFFARATILALKEFPRVNAFIDGDDVVYHQFVNLGIAVSTDRGLAVPVLRNVEKMSFAKIESEIKRVATAVRDGKLALDELSGGTFTITNGGIYGSLLSTPILNPPQSGILGMHAIQKRPVVVNDKVEIRSMMYIALSYDHRMVDGRESVSFLVRLKQYLEDPARLMLEI